MPGSSTVAAIAEVADAVRRRRAPHQARAASLVGAIDTVAGTVTATLDRALRTYRARHGELVTAARVAPIDPGELGFCAFRMFGVEDNEVRWTQWLGSCLRHASPVRDVVWAALIRAYPDAALDGQVLEEVLVEHHTAGFGNPDIVLVTDTRVVVLELKLDAPWSGEDQPERYSRWAELERERRGKRGTTMLLLTRTGGGALPSDWSMRTWTALARALRVELRARLHADSTTHELARLMPAILLVTAIDSEKRPAPHRDEGPWAEIAWLHEQIERMEGRA